MKNFKLIGSACSLSDLKNLVVQRWSWSDCIFKETEIKNQWTVQSSDKFAGFIEGLVVKKVKNRYRLESYEA